MTFANLSLDTILFWLYDFGFSLNFLLNEMLGFFDIEVFDGFTFAYLLLGGFYLYIQITIAKWVIGIIT